jgi:hypothetical protein
MLTSGMMAPEPDQSIGTPLGEIARDIRLAATGVSKDAAPAAEPSGMDVLGLLVVVTPILDATATVLGGISLFRLEPTALPRFAIAMGLGAFVMQYAFWLAALICGTMLLVSIISNMGDIFSG